MENITFVFYQDEHIVVVYKPYGVLSETDEKKPSVPVLLREEWGCENLYPVHRLDRTTQGLMAVAKTKEAAGRLSAQIQSGEMEKTYLAVVGGVPDPPEGELTDLLYFDRGRNKSYVVKRERRGVKQARLRYKALSAEKVGTQTLSLVSVRLLTGRTHQIRVQFASRKMPLAGDRRYGSRIACDHIMLCSSRLSFPHPVTGERMDFSYTPTNEYFGYFSSL